MSEYVWPAVVALVAVLAFLRLRPPPRGAKQVVVRRLQKQLKALRAATSRRDQEILTELESRMKAMGERVDKVTKNFPGEVNKVVQAIADDMTLLKDEWASMNTKGNLRKMIDDSKKTG